MTKKSFPGYDVELGRRGEAYIYPRPIPGELLSLRRIVRAVDWPVRVSLRDSKVGALDALCEWQCMRGIAYLKMLANATASARLVQDISQRPHPQAIREGEHLELIGRLRSVAQEAPTDVLNEILRACALLHSGGPYGMFVVAVGLTADSDPELREGMERSAALSVQWSATPEIQASLSAAGSVNNLIGAWLKWSERDAADRDRDRVRNSDIGSHPAHPLPAVEDLPEWLRPFLVKVLDANAHAE
ncbi:hypothetical protein ACMA1D_11565 [Streptomyces sp. 796.1]|uniref:hypothetical protein n=1 Tax=Streptomyces sp. 796.1 TaxID=3163029 RepID=UPI0039C93AA7